MKHRNIFKQILIFICSCISYIGGALLLSDGFMSMLKVVWFLLFYIGFIGVMCSIIPHLHLKYIGHRFLK